MHYRWKVAVVVDYKLDGKHRVSVGHHSDLPTKTKEGVSTWDVWDSESSVSLRMYVPTLTEKGDFVFQKLESIVTQKYAMVQYYNCTTPTSKNELTVCSLQVIPSFGNAREYEVNELQAPYTSAWARSILAGKLPKAIDGINVVYGPSIVYKNYGASSIDIITPTDKYGFHWTATYNNEKVTSLTRRNGFNGDELIAFQDIKWNKDYIRSFKLTELSVQAQKLVRPRTTLKFDLVSVDNSSPDVKPLKGARVFDYRLCPPVPLNSFPNKDCAPKTYICTGKLPSLAELRSKEDAGIYASPNTESHGVPAWIIATSIAILVSGVLLIWKSKKKV